MRTEEELRKALAEVTALLEGGRCSHSRVIVLYQRQHTLRWALGEVNTYHALDEITEEDD